MEKPRDELGAAVGSDMSGTPCLENTWVTNSTASAMDCRLNEDCLLQEAVDYHEDGVGTGRGRKGFNKIHGD